MEKKPKVLLLGLQASNTVSNSFPSLGVKLKAAWATEKKQGVPLTLVPIEKSSSVSYFFGHDVVDFLSKNLVGEFIIFFFFRRKRSVRGVKHL